MVSLSSLRPDTCPSSYVVVHDGARWIVTSGDWHRASTQPGAHWTFRRPGDPLVEAHGILQEDGSLECVVARNPNLPDAEWRARRRHRWGPEPGIPYLVEVAAPVPDEPSPVDAEQKPANPFLGAQNWMVLQAVNAVLDRMSNPATPEEEWHAFFQVMRARGWVEFKTVATKLDPPECSGPRPTSFPLDLYRGHEWDLRLPDTERAEAVAAWQAGETEYVRAQAPRFARELERHPEWLGALARTRHEVRDRLLVEAVLPSRLTTNWARDLAASAGLRPDRDEVRQEAVARLLGSILPAAARLHPERVVAYLRVAVRHALERLGVREQRSPVVLAPEAPPLPSEAFKGEEVAGDPQLAGPALESAWAAVLDATAEMETSDVLERLGLSHRQVVIVVLKVHGLTDAEIARKLVVSLSSVQCERRAIRKAAKRLTAA